MSKEEKRIEKVGVKAGSTRDASWCARSFDLCRKVDVIGTVGLVLAYVGSNSTIELSNFEGLILGCIKAKFCK